MALICNFCEKEDQNHIHLFCKCSVVRTFWNDVNKRLIELSVISVPISILDICFGFQTRNDLINTIIFYGKYYIFKCKYIDRMPIFNHFQKELMFLEKVERTISLKRGNFSVHIEKWKPVIWLISHNGPISNVFSFLCVPLFQIVLLMFAWAHGAACPGVCPTWRQLVCASKIHWVQMPSSVPARMNGSLLGLDGGGGAPMDLITLVNWSVAHSFTCNVLSKCINYFTHWKRLVNIFFECKDPYIWFV